MNGQPTAMRRAFERAFVCNDANSPLAAAVHRSLYRGVGLIRRSQMWAVARGQKR